MKFAGNSTALSSPQMLPNLRPGQTNGSLFPSLSAQALSALMFLFCLFSQHLSLRLPLFYFNYRLWIQHRPSCCLSPSIDANMTDSLSLTPTLKSASSALCSQPLWRDGANDFDLTHQWWVVSFKTAPLHLRDPPNAMTVWRSPISLHTSPGSAVWLDSCSTIAPTVKGSPQFRSRH